MRCAPGPRPGVTSCKVKTAGPAPYGPPVKSTALAVCLGLACCSHSTGSEPEPPLPDPQPACNDADVRCRAGTLEVCEGGQYVIRQQCGLEGQQCHTLLGCIDCDPGKPVCRGPQDIYECAADGLYGERIEHCEEACDLAECVGACELAETRRSYIGCEYWPVDLQNNIDVFANPNNAPCGGTRVPLDTGEKVCFDPATDVAYGICGYGDDCSWAQNPALVCGDAPACSWNGQHMPFTVVVANPHAEKAANVTLSNASGQSWSGSVAPGGLMALAPQELGFPDQSLLHSGITPSAYRLVSDMPLVAYQFNPLDNAFQFSNDGSLLIPAHTYETDYWAISYPTVIRAPASHNPEGFVTVVASSPGQTEVTIEAAGRVTTGLGVPAFGPGDPRSFLLQQYDTLNLKALGEPGGGSKGDDLTGTRIASDQPVGVFAGHDGTNMSLQCCLDHLEEQMFPTSAWGQQFAIARTQSRPNDQADKLRILAFRDGTEITVEPLGGTPCPTLQSGQFCTVTVTRDIELRASEPVLIGHLIASSGGDQPGDPSLSLPAPVEQFRDEYTFLTPAEYEENYASIVAPVGGFVSIDGVDVSGVLEPFGSLSFAAARVPITPGRHTVVCAGGCGLEVYGYGTDVSYMFAGGLELERLVIP